MHTVDYALYKKLKDLYSLSGKNSFRMRPNTENCTNTEVDFPIFTPVHVMW